MDDKGERPSLKDDEDVKSQKLFRRAVSFCCKSPIGRKKGHLDEKGFHNGTSLLF